MINRSSSVSGKLIERWMFNKLPHSNKSRLTLVLLTLDGVFFTLTNPNNVDSAILFTGFILLSLTLYLLISRVCTWSRLYGFQFDRHTHRIALFGTGIIVGLMALQSLGELTTRDMIVALPLGAITYAYLSYGRNKGRVSRPNLAWVSSNQ